MILVIKPNDKGYWLGWPEFKAYLLLLYHSWEMTCTSQTPTPNHTQFWNWPGLLCYGNYFVIAWPDLRNVEWPASLSTWVCSVCKKISVWKRRLFFSLWPSFFLSVCWHFFLPVKVFFSLFGHSKCNYELISAFSVHFIVLSAQSFVYFLFDSSSVHLFVVTG